MNKADTVKEMVEDLEAKYGEIDSIVVIAKVKDGFVFGTNLINVADIRKICIYALDSFDSVMHKSDEGVVNVVH